MSLGEAAVIDRFFQHLGALRTDVTLGIGDDAALLRPRPGCELVQTTDALVEQVHFVPGSPPRSLGHRALAINLSDVAAMGATPAWALLSLTLPEIDERWLGEFALGFGSLARIHEVALVGGNLSRGPLTVTVHLTAQVPGATALRRSGGRAGDDIWVSGTLGDAAQGRTLPIGSEGDHLADWLRARYEFPTPRVALGETLRGIANACIDLSDGLLSDLPRLSIACGCGAVLDLDRLPLSAALRARASKPAWQFALVGGEDYELCFTAPPDRTAALHALAERLKLPLTRCGQFRSAPGLELRRDGGVIQFAHAPFDHFAP